MKLIAIDSSGLVASCALYDEGIIRAEYTTDFQKTHSESLLPMLDEIVRMTGFDVHAADAVAVAAGPGSFTGLRIGSATAKGLGLALSIPLIEVPTLSALAMNFYGADDLVCPIMDARRNQVYNALYTFRNGELLPLTEQRALGVNELAEELNTFFANETSPAGIRRHVTFLGDGIAVYRDMLDQLLTVPHTYAPAHLARQRAASVAALGAVYFEQGKTVPAADHVPVYLRKSQAEREREKKLAEISADAEPVKNEAETNA